MNWMERTTEKQSGLQFCSSAENGYIVLSTFYVPSLTVSCMMTDI
jgi:hypothetical protein